MILFGATGSAHSWPTDWEVVDAATPLKKSRIIAHPDLRPPHAYSLSRLVSKIENLKNWPRPARVKIDGVQYMRRSEWSNVGVDDGRAAMEELVNTLYNAVGVPAPVCRLYFPPHQDGWQYTHLLCQWIEGLQNYTYNPWAGEQHQIGSVPDNFVLDAIFGNYHLSMDVGNIRQDERGRLVRVNNVGSLAAEHDGAWKCTNYTLPDPLAMRVKTWSKMPFNIWDLRRWSGNFYEDLTSKEIVQQVRKVKAMESTILSAISVNCPAVKDYIYSRIECANRVAMTYPDIFDLRLEEDDRFTRLPYEVFDVVMNLCGDLLEATPHFWILPSGIASGVSCSGVVTETLATDHGPAAELLSFSLAGCICAAILEMFALIIMCVRSGRIRHLINMDYEPLLS